MDTPNIDIHTYRRPKQKRGIVKFESLLDTAEKLIESSGIEKFSLYDVAEVAQVTSGSVYHFFPNIESLFIALAERHLSAFAHFAKPEDTDEIQNWGDLWRCLSSQARQYYNLNSVPAMLLLGPAATWTIRKVDVEGNRRIAKAVAEQMNLYFQMPGYPGLEDHLLRAITISDALWRFSYREHGMITESFWQDSVMASIAYLQCFYAPMIPAQKALGMGHRC